MINQNNVFFMALGGIIGFIISSTSRWLGVSPVFNTLEWIFLGIIAGFAVGMGRIR